MSRRKGANGELEFSRALQALGCFARRGRQFSGLETADVKTDLDGSVHFEVKRTERLRLYAALSQAIRDSAPSEVPIVAHRANREPWVLILRLDDLPQLLEAWKMLNTDITSDTPC